MENKHLVSIILKHLQYWYDHRYNCCPMGLVIDDLLNKDFKSITSPTFNMAALEEEAKRYDANNKFKECKVIGYDPLTKEICIDMTFIKEDGDTYHTNMSLNYKREYFN